MTLEKPVIKVRNVSKKYSISRQQSYFTLRDSIVNFFKKKDEIQPFWALKNVTFDINKGEILGIIGRNGAGKSTLLKILARITPPTKGEIRVSGRVASLLEVGTGFHSELNGRENIYLNGSILGMKKKEIDRNFDEIVRFSGVEKFIETPLKRYSSGMFVRLAFSVAAHLEPETLLIDEVLAVGDAQFQKKCLKKMKEVTEGGRTIIFVSHNMPAISKLCQKVMFLDEGKIKEIQEPDTVINHYLDSFKQEHHIPIAERKERSFSGDVIFTDLQILDADTHKEIETIISGQNILISLSYETKSKAIKSKLKNINVGLAFFTQMGQFIFELVSQQASRAFEVLPLKGKIFCKIPRFPLLPGNYYILAVLALNRVPMDGIDNIKNIDVIDGDFYGTGIGASSWGRFHGVYIPHSWSMTPS
ncbi:MAG: ABC transporter ATP-binding protein [Candidatus Thorarchaeota archaeon]